MLQMEEDQGNNNLESKFLLVGLVYTCLLLDNMLLTVIGNYSSYIFIKTYLNDIFTFYKWTRVSFRAHSKFSEILQ